MNDWYFTTKRFYIALLVAMAFFMENMDATIITTALPQIGRNFSISAETLSVAVSAYLVAVTVFIPISGWAADRFGAKRVFLTAIVVFTIASVFCALSENAWQFTFARIFQGIGGAMMTPVGRLVVLRKTKKSETVDAIAILTWPALIAFVIGPVVGGWIATNWTWHWIFLINIPIGILLVIASFFLIREEKREVGAFDWLGCFLCGAGFSIFMAGLELAAHGLLATWISVAVIALGLVILTVTVWYMRHAKQPLFHLTPFSYRTFRVAMISGTVFRTCVATAPFMIPIFFQTSFGWTAEQAGSMLMWLFIGNLAIKPATTWMMNTFGFRNILLVNAVITALGFAAMALFTINTSLWIIGFVLLFSGVSRSIQFTVYNTLAFADISDKHMRDATMLASEVQEMNNGMGISIGALAISIGASLVTLNWGPDKYQWGFWLIAVLSLLGLFSALSLRANDGDKILRHKRGKQA